MDRKLVIGAVSIIIVLALVLGFVIWQKAQVTTPPKADTSTESPIKQVDMASQPQWVQDLQVTTKSGVSANGLKNVTFMVSGMPEGMVESLDYIVQFDTTNKGSQGAMSTKPIEIAGKTDYSKTIDLGSCSTATCVHYDGVTAIDVELDFTTSSSEKFSFVKTISL